MRIINKLAIVGYGRHGKDEAGIYLGAHSRLRYAGSTSWAALPLMAQYLRVHPQVAWEQRHSNRQIWKDHCDELRRFNPTRLIDLALATGDIVTGIRGKPEILAAKEHSVDHILWIDRPGFPVDPTVDFGPEVADEIIVNDGTLEDFHKKLDQFAVAKLGGSLAPSFISGGTFTR